jgi:hypothetical protein
MTPAKKASPTADKSDKKSNKKHDDKIALAKEKDKRRSPGSETQKKKKAEGPKASKDTKPKPSAGKKKGKQDLPAPVPPELRQRMISETAYFMAERRGFSGGSAHDDWAAAEAEIDRMLGENAAG